MVENALAVDIYMVCQDQLIFAGFGEPVAPLFASISEAVQGHPDTEKSDRAQRWELTNKVLRLFREVLLIERADREAKEDKKTKKK